MATRNSSMSFWNTTTQMSDSIRGLGNGSREYAFTPAGNSTKALITITLSLIGGFALIANGLFLFLIRRKQTSRSFSRSLTLCFTESLAWSNFLCCVSGLPLLNIQILTDVFQTDDWRCRAVRLLQIGFPVITMLNLTVIGTERYIATFHPFSVLRKQTGKRLVYGAWLCGAMVTMFLVAPTFRAISYDLDHDKYTMICKYDNTVPMYRAMYLSFVFLVYIIPGTALTVLVIRIRRYIRSHRFIAYNKQCTLRNNAWRFKGTNMFLSLILAFILPYFLYMFYSAVNMALRPQVNFTIDYVIRYTGGLLAYCNAAIAPGIVFYSMRDMRTKLKDFLGHLICVNRVPPRNIVAVAYDAYAGQVNRIEHPVPEVIEHLVPEGIEHSLPEVKTTSPELGNAVTAFTATRSCLQIKPRVRFYQIRYSSSALKDLDNDGGVYY